MSIRLKLLRKQKAWSLETLAEHTGLTKSYLSKVERGLSVPSIAVAIKLARALEIDVEALFAEASPTSELVVTRASERSAPSPRSRRKQSQVHSIASGAASKRMLPFVIYPPRDFVASRFKEHDGEEMLFVYRGTIEVAFPNETIELASGDSLYFNALIPHKTRSIGAEQAEVLVVVSRDAD